MELWGTANGEDQLCIILGVVLCCSDAMVEMGWKVAGWASRSSVLYSERNNCSRRIGNEEIFKT